MKPPKSPKGGLKFLLKKNKQRLLLIMIYNGQKIDTPKYVIELAREQRIKLTLSEQLIWSKLRNKQLHGYRFRCQHPIYRYILDFYCHEALLAIEIDGDIHKYQKEYDNYRLIVYLNKLLISY
jgi:very-short-patch-repair endonuclease